MVRRSEGKDDVCGRHTCNRTAQPVFICLGSSREHQSPAHCPFEGHPDIQVRRQDPSKQEGSHTEEVSPGILSFLIACCLHWDPR